jgi:acyl carrier protein
MCTTETAHSPTTKTATSATAGTAHLATTETANEAAEARPDAAEIRGELRELIITQLVPLEDDELSDDSPLVDDILDSLGIAEVAIFIEDRIGRPLTEREDTATTFETVSSVVEFIVKNG